MKRIVPLLFTLLVVSAPPCTWAQGVGAAGTIGWRDTTHGTEPPIVMPQHRFGVAGSFDVLFHRSDFHTLPGVPSCCSNFPSGSGNGFAISILYEYSLPGNWIIGGRLGYERVAAAFSDREPTTLIVAGHATDGVFEYTLNAHYHLITFQPTASYRFAEDVLGRLSFLGHAGLGLGVNVGSAYSESERIAAPDGIGTYTSNGDAVRNQSAGSIPQAAAFGADIRFGLGMEAAINTAHTLTLGPELWYSFGLTHVVHSISWRVDALRAGLSLRLALM